MAGYARDAMRAAAVGAALFVAGSLWAYAHRGYWAVGGEYLFLTAPAWGVMIRAFRDSEDE